MNVSRELFKKVLDVLTDTTEKSHHEERQQALLDMLSAGALDYLEDEVKLKAQNVGFYRSVKTKVEKILKGSLDLITFTFSENSNYRQESLLEVLFICLFCYYPKQI